MSDSKREVKQVFRLKTRCAIQHTGWPCGTCFFALPLPRLTNADWQALLRFRGDYREQDLDNLPADWRHRVETMARRLQPNKETR